MRESMTTESDFEATPEVMKLSCVDSVLIRADPESQIVKFGPSGLQFRWWHG
jgi:hypothetical protein